MALAASAISTVRPLTIDRGLFSSTVPSYATIGQNYTVKVLVRSSANVTLPVLVRLEAPVDAFYIHPLLVEGSVSPHGELLANFSMVAFGSSYGGVLNVTAVVAIWALNSMSRPQVVDSVSLLVYSIRPLLVNQIALALVGLLVLVFVAIVAIVLANRKEGTEDRTRTGDLTRRS